MTLVSMDIFLAYRVKSCYDNSLVYVHITFMYPRNLFLTKHAVFIYILHVGSKQQEHKFLVRVCADTMHISMDCSVMPVKSGTCMSRFALLRGGFRLRVGVREQRKIQKEIKGTTKPLMAISQVWVLN